MNGPVGALIWWADRRRSVRARGTLAAVAVLAIVLTGCTHAAPDSTPAPRVATTSTSPAPGPSPAPTAVAFDASVKPVTPPELSGPPSAEAAGVVAMYFFDLFPYVVATGDLAPWDEITGSPCKYCASIRALADEIADAGNHSVGGQFEYTDVLTLDHRPNQYAVLLQLVQHPSQTVGPDGTVLEDFPDTLTASADMLVAWRDGGWKVDSVVFDLHRRERL